VRDAVEKAVLLEQLEQPAAEKAKEAEEKAKEAKESTCRGYTGKYTDARGSGGGTKYNWGYCSSECREAPRAPPKRCDHGRQWNQCKDCGTGYCKHGRQKGQCKDCGTGHCQHGRVNGRCMDCKYAIGNRQLGNRQ
jgi:hypothetical protein